MEKSTAWQGSSRPSARATAPNPARRPQDRDRPGVKLKFDTHAFQGLLQESGRGPIHQQGQGLGFGLHQGHLETATPQGLGGFQPHGAGPHHHYPAGWGQPGRQAPPVGQGAQGVDAGEFLPLEAQEARPGSGGDEQAVVGNVPPAQEVHGVGLLVHPHHRLPQEGLEVPLPKIILALEPDLLRGDLTAQDIRQQGAAVQGLGFVADDGDGAVGGVAPERLRGLTPRGAGPDNHVAHDSSYRSLGLSGKKNRQAFPVLRKFGVYSRFGFKVGFG